MNPRDTILFCIEEKMCHYGNQARKKKLLCNEAVRFIESGYETADRKQIGKYWGSEKMSNLTLLKRARIPKIYIFL